VRNLFIAQILLTFITACIWGVINIKAAPSVLYGGLACLLPNLFFVRYFFSLKHKKRPGQILVAFYMGEFIKMIISALIIILAVLYLNALLLPTVLGYFIANIAFWAAPTMVLKQQARSA